MDDYEPINDYCDLWQAGNLQIPEKIPSTEKKLDFFFIAMEIEKTIPSTDDDDDEVEEEEVLEKEFLRVVGREFKTFWEPCPRLESKNLSNDRISSILSKVGVPLPKQEFMVKRISSGVDEIANAPFNKDSKVLPVFVSISIVERGEAVEFCPSSSSSNNDDEN